MPPVGSIGDRVLVLVFLRLHFTERLGCSQNAWAV
jgi:hypothetical protein